MGVDAESDTTAHQKFVVREVLLCILCVYCTHGHRRPARLVFLPFLALLQGGGISLDDGEGPELMDIEVHMNTIDASQVSVGVGVRKVEGLRLSRYARLECRGARGSFGGKYAQGVGCPFHATPPRHAVAISCHASKLESSLWRASTLAAT